MRNVTGCVLILLCLLCLVAPATRAQDCTIAAYGDAAGTQSDLFVPETGTDPGTLSIYIVMFVESGTTAAAYKVEFIGMEAGWFLTARRPGSEGQGLYIDEDPASVGTNVALTECVLGFGGVPVLVEEYEFLVLAGYAGGQQIRLAPNANQDPDFPQYVTCTMQKRDCEVGPDAYVSWVFPVGDTSFSAIKALYH